MTIKQERLAKKLRNYWQFSLFQIMKLPASWFVGIHVVEVNATRAVVSLPFRWSSTNPFKSIYFAALCAAAEMSTGLLVLIGIEEHGNFSMLVKNFEAEFIKKANTATRFVCDDGTILQSKIDDSVVSKVPFEIVLTSTGYNTSDEVVCTMKVTWALKPRT
jgi:acyl-coenzyme A thioesterase PaaI-like protein